MSAPQRTAPHHRRFLGAAGRALLALSRALIWGNLPDGWVDLGGQPPSFQAAVRLALWSAILLACLLPFAGRLPGLGPLLPLAMPTGAQFIDYVPQLVVPLAYGLTGLAWGYLLAGAFGTKGWVRALLLALFTVFVLGTLSPHELRYAGGTPWALLSWVGLSLLLLLVGFGQQPWRRRGRELPLALHFPLIVLLCTLVLLGSYLATEHLSAGISTLGQESAVRFSAGMDLLLSLLIPLFLLVGYDVADVALELSQAGARWSARHLPGRTWPALLGCFLLIRLYWLWVRPLLQGAPRALPWGAVILAALLVLLYLLLRRRVVLPQVEETSGLAQLPALLLAGPLPVFQVLLALAAFVATWLPPSATLAAGFETLLERALALSWPLLARYPLLVGGGLFLAALIAWLRSRRREGDGPPHWAFFYLCLGGWILLWKSTRPSGLLAGWGFETSDLTAAATALLAGWFLWLLLRRRLTTAALGSLSLAALLCWCLEIYDLLADPLAPLAALPGASSPFLVASLLLGIAEMGGHFGLKADSPGMPRRSRVLLYLGYVLLAVVSVHWASLTHSTGYADGYAATGFLLIGFPLALARLLRPS